MERDKGIEPSYPAWKAGALANVLIPHKVGHSGECPVRRQELKERGEDFLFSLYLYYTKIFLKNQLICVCTNEDTLDTLHHNRENQCIAIPTHAIF